MALYAYRLETASNILVQMHQPSTKSSHQLVLQNLRLADLKPITIIGRGNMGTVILVAVLDGSTYLPFALKVMEKDASRKHKLQRMQLEKDILSRLNHPYLPSLYAHFESEQYMFLLTQFCSGGDLNALRLMQPEECFSEAAVQFYGAEVLLALEYLHKLGIVYRDLKPENVLIKENGHIMLTDFDLSLELELQLVHLCTLQNAASIIEYREKNSKRFFSLLPCSMPWLTDDCAVARDNEAAYKREFEAVKSAPVTPTQQDTNVNMTPKSVTSGECCSFVGTEEYVAPEILSGRRHGFPVDWWTFGILLHELVYGSTPFKSRNRKETFIKILRQDPDLPGSSSPLKDLISKLLVKDPIKRLGSCEGAKEVKSHRFFKGVKWEELLEEIFRPPYVPSPFSLEEKMKEKEKKL